MIKAKEEFKSGKNGIGYVESGFINEFGDDELIEGKALTSTKLKRSMTDSEIIKEFGIQDCTLGDVLKTLQNATDDMKDGNSNIFYIKGHSRVVFVGWHGREWYVDDWFRDDDSWSAGYRVFSPATSDATTLNPVNSAALTLEEAVKLCKQSGYKVTREKVIIEEL